MPSNGRLIIAASGSSYSLQIDLTFSCSLLDKASIQAKIQDALKTFYDQYALIVSNYIPSGFSLVNFNSSNVIFVNTTSGSVNCGKKLVLYFGSSKFR